MSGRRPTGLLLAVVAAVIAIGGVASALRAAPSARSELGQRLAAAHEPARFSLAYGRGGTRVLDCFQANVRYRAVVDTAAGRAAFSLEGDTEPVAMITPAVALLHRSLFDTWPFPTAWLSIARPVEPGVPAALQAAVGPDLSASLTAAAVPASGVATARAALDAAAGVDRLPAATLDGERVERYRITVDARKYNKAAAPTGPSAASTAEALPVFEISVNERDEVVAIAVRPQRPDGSPGPPEQGWTTDYAIDGARAPADPVAAEVTVAGAGDLAQLSPKRRDCQLPS